MKPAITLSALRNSPRIWQKLYGLSHREVEMLEIISPMHDVGKIAIPETILDKPGKLTPDEWAIMQTHTHTGHKLLSSSKGEIFQLAAIVALQHHEKVGRQWLS
ncbi:HD domain-containing protein [Vibrio sinaloensis]|nr:HD domain-containing protein [Vibrio sinaloensis]